MEKPWGTHNTAHVPRQSRPCSGNSLQISSSTAPTTVRAFIYSMTVMQVHAQRHCRLAGLLPQPS